MADRRRRVLSPPTAPKPATSMGTLPHSSPPYVDLDASERSDLLSLVHFCLLFHAELRLPAHALLGSQPEDSLLSAKGAVYDALVTRVVQSAPPTHRAFDAERDLYHHTLRRLDVSERFGRLLLDVATALSADNATRLRCTVAAAEPTDGGAALLASLEGPEAGCTKSADQSNSTIVPPNAGVAPAARLRAGARDANAVPYVWVRGSDACASARVDAGGRVWIGDCLDMVADALETRGRAGGGKADVIAAGWMRDRLAKARARGRRVEAEREALAERVRMMQVRKEERERRAAAALRKLAPGGQDDGTLVLAGETVVLGESGRGRRERRVVSYRDDLGDEERAGEDYEEEEEEEEEEEDDGGEDFVLDAEDATLGDDEAGEETDGDGSEHGSRGDDDGESARTRRLRAREGKRNPEGEEGSGIRTRTRTRTRTTRSSSTGAETAKVTRPQRVMKRRRVASP